jgi:hypothetical protein
MNKYRIPIMTRNGGWNWVIIFADSPFDARDLAVSVHGDKVMGYAESC